MLNLKTIDKIIHDIALPIKNLFILHNRIINFAGSLLDHTTKIFDIKDECKIIDDEIIAIDKQMSELYQLDWKYKQEVSAREKDINNLLYLCKHFGFKIKGTLSMFGTVPERIQSFENNEEELSLFRFSTFIISTVITENLFLLKYFFNNNLSDISKDRYSSLDWTNKNIMDELGRISTKFSHIKNIIAIFNDSADHSEVKIESIEISDNEFFNISLGGIGYLYLLFNTDVIKLSYFSKKIFFKINCQNTEQQGNTITNKDYQNLEINEKHGIQFTQKITHNLITHLIIDMNGKILFDTNRKEIIATIPAKK